MLGVQARGGYPAHHGIPMLLKEHHELAGALPPPSWDACQHECLWEGGGKESQLERGCRPSASSACCRGGGGGVVVAGMPHVLLFSGKSKWGLLTLEGPTLKTRHASVFSTHSDTQAVPAFHCEYECLNAFFRHASVFKTHRHAVYHCLKEVQKPFRHASVF